MLEECGPRKGAALTDVPSRGAPGHKVRQTYRRSRLRPPGGAGGPVFKGPPVPREPSPAAHAIPSRPGAARTSLNLSLSKEARQERAGAGPRPQVPTWGPQGGFRPRSGQGAPPVDTSQQPIFLW